jgi:hypothetical protein
VLGLDLGRERLNLAICCVRVHKSRRCGGGQVCHIVADGMGTTAEVDFFTRAMFVGSRCAALLPITSTRATMTATSRNAMTMSSAASGAPDLDGVDRNKAAVRNAIPVVS